MVDCFVDAVQVLRIKRFLIQHSIGKKNALFIGVYVCISNAPRYVLGLVNVSVIPDSRFITTVITRRGRAVERDVTDAACINQRSVVRHRSLDRTRYRRRDQRLRRHTISAATGDAISTASCRRAGHISQSEHVARLITYSCIQ